MKGRIDESGNLHIERAGKCKPQVCPTGFDAYHIPAYCGDWCPLFGEPKLEIDGKSAIIEICNGKTLFLDQFTDEREQKC